MRKRFRFLITCLLLLGLAEFNSFIFSQQFTDGLKARLSISERNKLLEAEALEFKGNSKLKHDNSGQTSTAQSKSKTRASAGHAINELDAIAFFVFSNDLKFKAINKAINDFHNSYKGKLSDIEALQKIEKTISDSVIWVNDLRRASDREKTIVEKSPLLNRAWLIENHAILRLEKLLYIYLRLPESCDFKWIYSNDTFDPFESNQANSKIINSNQSIDTGYTAHLAKAMEIFDLLEITEPQLEFFNEFLASQFPLPDDGIDFMKVAYSNLDSLKFLWQTYLYSGGNKPDSAGSGLITKISTSNKPTLPGKDFLKSKSTSAFNYKIQILASTNKMSNESLHQIYSGKDNIDESIENGLYKYTLGNFKTYKEAKSMRDRLNIEGAFIAAYLNGKRIEVGTYTRLPRNKPVRHEIGVR